LAVSAFALCDIASEKVKGRVKLIDPINLHMRAVLLWFNGKANLTSQSFNPSLLLHFLMIDIPIDLWPFINS
jgi:hypothetical protein